MDIETRAGGDDEVPDVVQVVDASWGHRSDEGDVEDARTRAEPGVVAHRSGALGVADAMFSCDPQPHCLTDF